MFAAGKSTLGTGTSGPGDPLFNYVTLLLRGDGSNAGQNNTFLDSSGNNFTVTRNGNVTQGSFSPYGSNWSNYFNGVNGTRINITSSTSLNAGSGDFCLECWFNSDVSYTSYYLSFAAIVGKGNGNNVGEYSIGAYNSVAYFALPAGGSLSGTTTLKAGTWYHVAVTRSGSTLRLFLNGVLEATSTNSTDFTNSRDFAIGDRAASDGSGQYPFNGRISNVRFVKGSAVYTGTFTPSTTPLTAITNTQLLTCHSNRFVDASTNNLTINAAAAVSVQRFGPFLNSTAYLTGGIGGSGYFDGTNGHLSTTVGAIGTQPFTFECWLYNTAQNNQPIFTLGGYQTGIDVRFDQISSDVISGYIAGTSYTFVSDPTPNQWAHFALTRDSGNTVRAFYNGVLMSTATGITANLTNTNLRIGALIDGGVSGNQKYTGYMSDFRYVIGNAVYTSSFTPPTAPVTQINGTSLLLNYTNGAIIDNAMMNDSETVGTAQISTGVKKYGSGSISIGSSGAAGDHLTFKNNPALYALPGDFTVEFWLYKNSASQYAPIVETRTADDTATGIYLMDYNSTLVCYPFYSVAPSIESSTWIHFAVARSGDTLSIYKNGVFAGSAACSTSTYTYGGGNLWIGSFFAGGRYFNGYIDDLRITKGYARYAPSTPTASASNTTSTALRGDGSPVSKFFGTGSYGIFNTVSAGNYLVVDFGQAVSNVTTTYRNAAGSGWAPTSVLIQSSNDNSAWTTRTTYSDTSSSSVQSISSTGTGRYWRMYQNSATRTGSSGYEWHINNFSMIADALNGSFTPPDAALPVNG